MPYVFNPFTGTLDITGSGAAGDITGVAAGTGLTGGGTTGDVTLSLANTAVSAGSYTYASITVDAQGRLTAASSGTAPVTSVTGTAPISSSGGTTPAISISAATTSAAGSMSAADKTKLDGIESGAQVNVATNLTYTASTRALDSSTGTDVTLPLFDTASANAGLVPGSSTGGTTNFLRADGTWAPPGATPGGSTTQIQFNDAGSFAGDADLTWNKTTNLLTTKGDISLDDGGTYTTTLQTVTPTAARTISLPDATGTVALVAGSSGQVIYNNAGANAGISTLTVDGSGNLTLTGRLTNSYTSIASSPANTFTGTWFTGGTSTTTKPHVLIEPSGATSTGWSTSGTGFGVNAASGFTGRLLDLQLNGSSNFNVDYTGRISVPFGTAALPSISPGTDSDTGIWFPAVNTLSISTGGTQRFHITSAGLVHLGNGATAASPSAATLSATGGFGLNIAGAALTVRGGVSTGSAAGGSLILQTTPAGSAGSSINTSTTRLTIDSTGLFTFADAINLEVGTTTGTKIGTATTQKLGFYNATPVVQPAAVADITTTATTGTLPTPDGTVTIADAATPTVSELLEYCVELEAKLETALSRLRTLGLIAT